VQGDSWHLPRGNFVLLVLPLGRFLQLFTVSCSVDPMRRMA
jgi:hypothetical protein